MRGEVGSACDEPGLQFRQSISPARRRRRACAGLELSGHRKRLQNGIRMRSRQARPKRARAHPEFAAVALGALSSLYNFAYRLVGNETDAEDLVQETYVDAFRHAGQLRNLARCRAWLFRILRNRQISRARMRRARPELIILEGGLEAVDASMAGEALPQLERAVVARLTRPAILHALATLPEDMRSAL